ncbi:Protein DBF4-like protein B isoform X3 [Aix galericulata]|nr:Protein DBF4-like protein B isoform X3 [Aix galericulata]
MAGPATTGRPLRGKSFYLDVPSGRAARDLAAAIRHLGGVTECFLSKEVNYVVSSNKEAKRDKAGTRTEKRSNTRSEDAKAKSRMPSTSKGNHTRLQQKPPDTALISRGKELLQKAMKNQDTCSGSSILANARLWGVQILHVDAAACHLRIEEAEPEDRGKLKPPFLKVEDQSRQFRPFHHQFKSFPDLNFLAPKSSSPFEPLKNLSNSCRARGVEGCPMHSNGEKSPQSTPVTVPKKKRGFCECCQETFEELQKHLQSPQHKRFALDDSRYAPVDRVISQLTNDFVEQPAKVLLCCLTDEHLMPRAQVTGGIEKLTAELGKESQQPEQGAVDLFDAEPDPGLKIKECSSSLPRDRVSNSGEEGRLTENCSLGLSVRAGLTAGVCAARATTEEFAVVGDTDSDLAPEFAWGTCVAASHVGGAIASSSEPDNQQVLGSVSRLPQALPASRKRQLSPRQSTQVRKKPRLELGGEKIAPELPSLPSHSKEQTLCPGLLHHLPCNTQADDNFRKSSSESDWDVQLLSTLTGVQDSKIRVVDRDLLQRTHVNVRDSGYESQLCSVLKQNSDFEWAAKGDKSCRNYCTETKEAPLPIFETFFGSWTTLTSSCLIPWRKDTSGCKSQPGSSWLYFTGCVRKHHRQLIVLAWAADKVVCLWWYVFSRNRLFAQ